MTAQANNIDIIDYELSKISVHTPAEHVFNYTTNQEILSTPSIEVQFFFKPVELDQEYIAVVSILLTDEEDPDSNHEFAAALLDLVRLASGETSETSTETFFTGTNYDPVYKMYSYMGINENNEHISDSSPMMGYYFYKGSQTKPDCLEEVYWYVFREVLPVTTSTLSKIEAFVGETYQAFSDSMNNARDVQNSTGRQVRLEGCNPVYSVLPPSFSLYDSSFSKSE